MAYGRRRTYRRPRRRTNRYRYQKRNKAAARHVRRGIKRGAKNIQAASRAPMSRTVQFQDTRTYIVKDEGTGAGAIPIPIIRNLQLNDPQNMFPTGAQGVQGTWDATDYTAKGPGMPGIATWVTNKDGTGTGVYRLAECVATKVVISAIWLDETGVEETEQAMSKLIVRKCTKLTDSTEYMQVTPSTAFNSDRMCRFPYVKSADLYSGTNPKGATITTNYSFKRLNRGSARSSLNHFFNDTGPVELDFLQIMIMPQNKSYSATAERCGTFRIQIKVDSIVNLSEPNTSVIGGESDGFSFSSVKRKAQAMMGGGGPGDDS